MIMTSLLLDVVQALELFVLERLPNYTFLPLAPPPVWVSRVFALTDQGAPVTFANTFPFLEPFLTEADAVWREGTASSLFSGSFVAPGEPVDVLLRACAMNLGGRHILVLERLHGDADVRPVLQKSRENKLQEERLLRQLEALRAPVATLSTLVSRLRDTDLTSAQRDLVDGISKTVSRVQSVTGST